jgi:hypothetical protein
MTAERRFIDYGTSPSIFTDRLVIEQHGTVTHLIFCHDQREWPGQDCVVSVVDCRVIVPSAMLPQLARQLACPEAQELTEGDSEALRH